MDTNKMIRVAKKLDVVANVGGKIAAAAGVVCMITAFFTLIFGSRMFAEGEVALSLDFVKFHLNDNTYVNEQFLKLYICAATLGGSVICFVVSYISKLLRRILVPMQSGRPFESGVSELLKKVGWAVLFGGLLSEMVGFIARLLLMKAYSMDELFALEAIQKTEFVFDMNVDFVLIACVVFLLSYIFTYGQILQQDADETL